MTRPSGWLPTPEEKRRLLEFEGYGPDNPEIVFVGLEEYCDPNLEKQRQAIWTRATSPAFAGKRVDRSAATLALTGLTEKDGIPVWNLMASIVSAATGQVASVERKALGSRPAKGVLSTLLTELRPLPRPGSDAFANTYIPEWFPEFPTVQDYLQRVEEVTGPRIVQTLLSATPPRFAFFYGRPVAAWARQHLAPHFQGSLRSASNGTEVAITASGTRVALTGFFNGQHAASAFRPKHVATLIEELTALR